MKLVLAVVLSLCVAYVVADNCDGLQRFKVQRQWHEAFGTGHHRIEFGVKLFAKLFHDHPEARALFDHVNGGNIYSPEFKAHTQRVLGGLDMTVGLLDDPPAIAAQLAHLKEQHATRNVKKEYYIWLGQELGELLPEYLGTELDFAAWRDCFKRLVDGISS